MAHQQYHFRAAAFWRVVANVYTMTKKNPEVFLGSRIEDDVWDNPEDQVLVNIIYDIGRFGAKNRFPTNDEEVLAKATAKVIRAFVLYPELYGKIAMCCPMQAASLAMMGNMSQEKMNAANRRAEEVRDLSKMFREIGLSGDTLALSATISQAQENEYLSISIKA